MWAHLIVEELVVGEGLGSLGDGQGAGGSGGSSTAKLRYDLIRMDSMFMDRSRFSGFGEH